MIDFCGNCDSKENLIELTAYQIIDLGLLRAKHLCSGCYFKYVENDLIDPEREPDEDYDTFCEWYVDNRMRFHSGQFSAEEIAYSAWAHQTNRDILAHACIQALRAFHFGTFIWYRRREIEILETALLKLGYTEDVLRARELAQWED